MAAKFYADGNRWIIENDASNCTQPFTAGACIVKINNSGMLRVIEKRNNKVVIPWTNVTSVQQSETEEDYYTSESEFWEAIDAFFASASGDGGETPTILTQSGSNSMGLSTLGRARSVTITAGTWIVTGNIFCDGSATSSGYAKAALNLSYNTFDILNTTQIDMDSNENDIGFSVMPMSITVTENTPVFINFEREEATTEVSLYSKIQAIKIG